MKVKIIIACFAAFLVAWYVPPVLYFKNGWFKKYFHGILGWHIPDEKPLFDGVNKHAICKYCHKDIMQDSQGNWF